MHEASCSSIKLIRILLFLCRQWTLSIVVAESQDGKVECSGERGGAEREQRRVGRREHSKSDLKVYPQLITPFFFDTNS